MKIYSIITFCLLSFPLIGQMEIRWHDIDREKGKYVMRIPRDMTADSVMHYIYDFQPSSYGIKYGQRWGWLKPSSKFDTNDFYELTKQYCIERVGEDYFYEHFRFDRHSFQENNKNDIYYIHYYFFPKNFVYDHVKITFKKFSFYGIEEIQFPNNVPDCREKKENCDFPITRRKAYKIVKEQVLKDKELQINIRELSDTYKWKCTISSKGNWYGENFTIDARTGEVSIPKQWRRID